jgi:Holliday junction resolvasome RuvABC DNA-binding subunit
MLLELKDKVGRIRIDEEAVMLVESGAVSDAVSALINLGISPTVAEYAVYKAERNLGKDARIEDIIGQALKSMGS